MGNGEIVKYFSSDISLYINFDTVAVPVSVGEAVTDYIAGAVFSAPKGLLVFDDSGGRISINIFISVNKHE